jgi:general secretion pathway protein K
MIRQAGERRRAPETRGARDASRPDRGLVLVSVLWLLALLTLVTLVLLTAVRLDVRATGQLGRHAEAEALADGLMRLVALRLGDRDRRPLDAAGLARDGTPMFCRHEDAVVAIAVTDVGGLVDLNAASANLLEWLLRGLGVAPDKAAALAAAILDFRDEDDVPGVNGAESAAYRAAGLAHGPKNAPFETVTELDQVLGMDLALLDHLRAVATVHSRQPGIDARVAPREVLSAAAASPRIGAAAASPKLGAPEAADIPPEFRIASRGRAFRVTVAVQLLSAGRFAREAVIEPERTAPLGFRVREWTVPAPGMVAVPEPSTDTVQCVHALA